MWETRNQPLGIQVPREPDGVMIFIPFHAIVGIQPSVKPGITLIERLGEKNIFVIINYNDVIDLLAAK